MGGKKVCSGFAFVCLFLSVFFYACGPSTTAGNTPTVTLSDLAITTQIAGWAPLDTTAYFVDSTMINFVNGGNVSYCGACNGNSVLKAGICTKLATGQNNKAKIFVMDYGTSANAITEFNARVNSQLKSSVVPIGSFSQTVAVGSTVGGGLYTFCCMKNFYIESQLSNYDSTAVAQRDANVFLTYYQSKIKP